MGGDVLAPEGLHAGLHNRARLHGQDQAGVRQARRQDHRPLSRPGRPPCRLGRRHQGDAGLRAELSDDRRRRFQCLEALRHAAGSRVGRPDQAHRGRQPDRAQCFRHWPGQESEAHSGLSDEMSLSRARYPTRTPRRPTRRAGRRRSPTFGSCRSRKCKDVGRRRAAHASPVSAPAARWLSSSRRGRPRCGRPR